MEYESAKIYCLKSKYNDQIYICHTTKDNCNNIIKYHKNQYHEFCVNGGKFFNMYNLFKNDDLYAELIGEYNNISKKEFLKLVAIEIHKHRDTCCNTQIPAGITSEERRYNAYLKKVEKKRIL